MTTDASVHTSIGVPVRQCIPKEKCSVVVQQKERGNPSYKLRLGDRQIIVASEREESPAGILETYRLQSIQCCYCGCTILSGDRVMCYREGERAGPLLPSASRDARGFSIGCILVDCCDGLAGFEGLHFDGAQLIQAERF